MLISNTENSSYSTRVDANVTPQTTIAIAVATPDQIKFRRLFYHTPPLHMSPAERQFSIILHGECGFTGVP